jgi:pyruvate/2-oxoglutarate/acetoin dehydrogenase E1 component
VTACYFGDGAVAEGEFHECMNLAALWSLPVLFLCENNLYAMGTAIERYESETDLALKAASYEMTAVCSAEVPIPYPRHLEQVALPQPETVVAEARRLIGDV